MLWGVISTVAAIAGIILGVARYIAAVRKAKADQTIGALKTETEGLKNAVEAAHTQATIHGNVVRMPDRAADAELSKWMRD